MKHLILMCLILNGCVILPQDQLDDLTACSRTLNEVRRTLLKLGFGLKADESDFITTDFLKTDFGFSAPGLATWPQAFIVEKVSESKVRIKTKLRDPDGSVNEPRPTAANQSRLLDIKTHLCADPSKS